MLHHSIHIRRRKVVLHVSNDSQTPAVHTESVMVDESSPETKRSSLPLGSLYQQHLTLGPLLVRQDLSPLSFREHTNAFRQIVLSLGFDSLAKFQHTQYQVSFCTVSLENNTKSAVYSLI